MKRETTTTKKRILFPRCVSRTRCLSRCPVFIFFFTFRLFYFSCCLQAAAADIAIPRFLFQLLVLVGVYVYLYYYERYFCECAYILVTCHSFSCQRFFSFRSVSAFQFKFCVCVCRSPCWFQYWFKGSYVCVWCRICERHNAVHISIDIRMRFSSLFIHLYFSALSQSCRILESSLFRPFLCQKTWETYGRFRGVERAVVGSTALSLRQYNVRSTWDLKCKNV